MANVWRSFWSGWGAAARLWPAVLLVYLVDAVLAAILVAPVAVQLDRVFGHSTMASDLGLPLTLNVLLEAGGDAEAFPLPWPLYLLVPAISVLAGTFLRGGVLGALARTGARFNGTVFFADCARFFGRFLVLLLLFAPAVLVLFVSLAGASPRMLASASTTVTWMIVLGLLWLALVLAMDYARVSLVLAPERSVFRHVARGVWFVVRRLPQVLLLGLLFGLLAALIAALYPALAQLSPSLESFLPALMLQQLAALLASWHRIAMLGGETSLFRRIRYPDGRALEVSRAGQ